MRQVDEGRRAEELGLARIARVAQQTVEYDGEEAGVR
jgi:hypothetical protein